MKIDNWTLYKNIGKGTNSELFLAKKENDLNNYIAKQYINTDEDNSDLISLIKNEVMFLEELSHPNVIKLNDVKKTKTHIFCIFEYCNGGNLSKILENYQQKYGKPFSLEIIQYLMKQMIEALKYLHQVNIIHLNIKLENILVNFNDEKDLDELNMMKSQVKIANFKYAGKAVNLLKLKVAHHIKLEKPKFTEKDKKTDILHLGEICCQMLLGKYAVNSDIENMVKIIDEIIQGKNNSPIVLSKEILSFMKNMITNDVRKRAKIYELLEHEFLEKDVKNFQIINQKPYNINK